MEIKARYEHSKIGQFMFDLCASGTKFIIKHRGLYYLLACTWGIIMTALGGIISIILLIVKFFGIKVNFEKYTGIYKIKVGPDYGGGCEMGLMFLRDGKSRDRYIDDHEFGHTFQNCLLGPLFPFLVALPSATRYWLMEFFPKGDGKAYDAVGFEDAATQCGNYAYKYLTQNNL